jgi:hypothetical protein
MFAEKVVDGLLVKFLNSEVALGKLVLTFLFVVVKISIGWRSVYSNIV